MPRRPRIKLAGIPQHIVQRGINREACFFAEEDYHCYLHWLTKIKGVRLEYFHQRRQIMKPKNTLAVSKNKRGRLD